MGVRTHGERLISHKEFASHGRKTVEVIIRLGRDWAAGIDERGYSARWEEIVAGLKT